MSAPSRVLRYAIFLSSLLLLCDSAFATGRLIGSIKDADGNPIGGVEIRMLPLDEDLPTTSAKSNKKGKFVFGLLRKANYRLVAFADGMRISRVDANLEVPEDENLWSYHHEMPPGAEMPIFSVTGVTQVTYDLTLAPHDGDPGDYGTGVPISPTKLIVGLIHDGDLEKAAAEISRYLEASPGSPTIHYLHAFQLLTVGNDGDALGAINTALSLEPSFEGAELLKGRILESRGDSEPALESYRSEAKSAKSVEVARDANLAAATILIKLDRQEEAIEALESLIAIAPEYVGAYKELADLYLRQGNQEKAKEMLATVNSLGATDPNILYNMGAERFNARDFDGARGYFLQTLEADPTFADAHVQLAYTLLNLGDLESAATSLEKFLELASEDDSNVQTARSLLEQLRKK